MKTPYNTIKSIVKDTYELFKNLMPYQQAMDTAIKNVLSPIDVAEIIHPSETFPSKEALTAYLINELQYEVNVHEAAKPGEHHTLTDNIGHKPWYRESIAANKINFKFWSRYKKYLTNIKGWNSDTVDKLDAITDDVLERIEDPTEKNRPFDRRGLVVGYVQSGKTANFTGVINKAIDCGYKVIIVLSGMHKNLRSQTQMRIDEEIIGRDTSQRQVKRIGVTTLPNEGYINVDTFTTQDDNGDFSRSFAQQMGGVQPGSDRPMMFVIKKNVSVLKNLIRYFNECIETLGSEYVTKGDNDRFRLNNLPLLLIDDEADQASPNTKALTKDDEELDPTAINKNIRALLNLFNQRVYLGYTATPFANIFIHHSTEHSEYGKDLFPSSFIISMDAPSNYFGPVKVFGLNDDKNRKGLPIHIPVTDASLESSEFLPLKHSVDEVPDHIPPSMKEAIKAFIISSAVRWIRGQGNKHNTMLIHCTRFTNVQNAVAYHVEEEFTRLRNGIVNDDASIREECKLLFEKDYIRISQLMNTALPEWKEVEDNLKPAVLKMQRRPHVINGTAGDVLDYKTHESIGLSIIAIGGDKLSRGLTLEGLTISYFTRASTLYDTLMQMGRWFGYRIGFEDLCRIYTTNFLFTWYRDISTAFELLRKEFLEMVRQKSTPELFGLRVLSHPDMMATSAMKMRYTETMPLSYKGKLTETASISGDRSILANNFLATEDFLQSISNCIRETKGSNYLWRDVPRNNIVSFLEHYISYTGSPASNTKRILEFINKQYEGEEPNNVFDYWNVCLFSVNRSKQSEKIKIGRFDIIPATRSIKEPITNNKLYIQRLVGSSDEKVDFETETSETSDALRKMSPRISRALLMIYPLQIEDHDSENLLSFENTPIGFGISWPNNELLKQSTYEVNSVYKELELQNYD